MFHLDKNEIHDTCEWYKTCVDAMKLHLTNTFVENVDVTMYKLPNNTIGQAQPQSS